MQVSQVYYIGFIDKFMQKFENYFFIIISKKDFNKYHIYIIIFRL